MHYGWVVLGDCRLVVFGALGLARFGHTMVLPSMQADLGLTNTQAGVLATANLAGYLVFSVVGGALVVRYRPRIVVTVGLSVVATGMLFSPASRRASRKRLSGELSLGSGAARATSPS